MLACQVALYPLGVKEYPEIIKDVLASWSTQGLEVETNSMSTILRGEEEEVWRAVKALFKAAACRGEVVLVATFSNRCGCKI
ncbi:MAG: Ykof family thiamine-binding protein [Thermanaeromonas sp.]|uniref:YkoF family thiamine/hydroxymethylpyrimidine-binding protein n=1 Tax=Thermanaeromonas sp. TaxID=2003697 RepID=UPI00243F9E3A|nr:YkoF family thiamine/hydroxymethylpyrimidine-binding protein [Thermanaeromonas sp.]MCG0278570.1 Ykof family thiamine-binding protein [Thermanaeromonas sp.]